MWLQCCYPMSDSSRLVAHRHWLKTHRSKLCDDATDWIHFQSHPLDARIGRAVSTNNCEIRLISVLLPIKMPMFLILCHYWLQRSKTFGNWLLTLPPLEKSRPRSQRGSIQCHCFPLFRRRNKISQRNLRVLKFREMKGQDHFFAIWSGCLCAVAEPVGFSWGTN